MASKLDAWIARIKDKDMPIFGKTVQAIINVSESDIAPASQLAKVVLQDASLTTKVLKLVNSTYYNPSRGSISTVSRAVVVMGFHSIRNICLSIGLVDSMVSGGNKDQLTKELARAIHAAVQAREIAVQMKDPEPEEIFVSTLLHNIGDLAFWCNAEEDGEKLIKLMETPGYTPEKAQQELLGFQLDELTLGLVQNWNINRLLEETLREPSKASSRGRTVILAQEVAKHAAEHGWESEQVKETVTKIARLTQQKEDALLTQMQKNASEAVTIASVYGASKAAQVIPVVGQRKAEKPAEEAPVKEFPEPDPMLQLRILRELSQIAENKSADFNLIMETVMEGVHRGVGFDRTLFCLVTPDRKGLYGRFALGRNSEAFTKEFHFNRNTDPHNIFFRILDSKAEIWLDVEKNPVLKPTFTPGVQRIIGLKPFFVGSIVVSGKAIGLIYADRSFSGRRLDEDSFSSFKHFTSETGMILTQRLNKR